MVLLLLLLKMIVAIIMFKLSGYYFSDIVVTKALQFCRRDLVKLLAKTIQGLVGMSSNILFKERLQREVNENFRSVDAE